MKSVYEISLALTTVLLLVALWWSVALRRVVKAQTEKIRRQLAVETALERRCSDLFDNASDMIYAHDLRGSILTLNTAGERLVGFGREKAAGISFREFVAEDQRESFDEWMEMCKRGGSVSRRELAFVSPLGHRSILELSARLIEESGKAVRIEGIGRDITARKQAEEALRESEERFSRSFQMSPVAMALSTISDARFMDVNESFLRMFEFNRESVLNRTANDLSIWEDPEDLRRINHLLQEGSPVCGREFKFRTRSGASRVAVVFAERIQLSKNPCIIFITHDVTERILMEAQLRNAQKLEAIGRLSAGVAHDFNNLLTVIQGHAEMVMGEPNLPAPIIESMEIVCGASQRAANLTRQLCTFSRQQAMQSKPLNLNQTASDFTKMVKHLVSDNIDLKYNFAAHLPPISADVTMIEQVVMNLVVNARDAMARGGTLVIGTHAAEITESYLQTCPEARVGEFVCLTVSDTGCGMDAATQVRVFEPFFTTKAFGAGTGLGLATVYGIAKQHGGWVELKSEVGKGTTFKIFFPAGKDPKSAQAGSKDAARVKDKETILLVEDEPQVGNLVRHILQRQGYRVLYASGGIEALQMWNENRDDIDLLLTDMVMPAGMSGRELAMNLTALKPDLKIIYTTGYSKEVTGQDLDLTEGLNFLPKPHSPPKLLETIRARLATPVRSMAA